MSYSIEQEIKSLLTQEEFYHVLDYFDLGATDYQSQHNTYFDSDNQVLKHHQAALRLRNFQTTSEWTYKQKQDTHRSLELTYTQSYPQLPVPESILVQQVADDVIRDQLEQLMPLNTVLTAYLSIKTHRWTVKTPYGEYAIDQTFYGNTSDYEIELETDDLPTAMAAFKELLATLSIPYRAADKKIARALKHLAGA
ncbi:CYTH domain-containing protein [Tuanshanicoccus lijuaniae]|uniref:CYTH domain-containing protein n=1 Tax=Aerococcaceae bacterium zg-1292 TaxID=2774330 RepID=UPI0019368541|nr:CYTH domain-containing protein [Aerococcaceae bacterium zg-1292]QQA37560.1 CYTH domain-containing protein [Aerococcaceae bacterium zg-1292]